MIKKKTENQFYHSIILRTHDVIEMRYSYASKLLYFFFLRITQQIETDSIEICHMGNFIITMHEKNTNKTQEKPPTLSLTTTPATA